MIVKLYKKTAFNEKTRELFRYSEDGFNIYSDQREEVKFLRIEDNKGLNFLDMLELGTWGYGDALIWYKKQ